MGEITIRDLFVFNQFVCFWKNASHILYIKVADVGSKQGLYFSIEWIVLSVERPSIGRIIGFTAEVESVHKQRLNVRRFGNFASRIIIQFGKTPRCLSAIPSANSFP